MDNAVKLTRDEQPLSPDALHAIEAYWCAANYLAVGQIYLLGNPLLREPLTLEQDKSRLLGHWGTTPGLHSIYVHLNHVMKVNDLSMRSRSMARICRRFAIGAGLLNASHKSDCHA